MKKTSIKEILAATEGRLIRKGEADFISGIKHDSRDCEAGDMFVAIVGQNQDGHKYIPQLAKSGCTAFLVSHEEGWLAEIEEAVNIIRVDDTIEAMAKLASWYLDELDIKKVAVTGSVGKTSTRDMIYYVLSEKFNCGRNLKNYNNNIGLSISIFQFDENIEAAVLEMGMDAFGEIDYLSRIVRPEIGVITNIGVSHMEKLGSREGIFKAKMEISQNIVPRNEGGTLIFSADEEFLTKERTAGDYEQIRIGYDEDCDYVISDVDDFGIEGIKFSLAVCGQKLDVKLPIPGVHNAVNATLALACGLALGVDAESALQGLAKVELTGSRLKVSEANGIKIIDDTYNANPDSMKSALDVMMKSQAKRRVAILGDMFELGEDEVKLHRSVGEHAKEIGVDLVITLGELAKNIAEGAGGKHFNDKSELLTTLDGIVEDGDLILVKASRGMKMEDVVNKLKGRLI